MLQFKKIDHPCKGSTVEVDHATGISWCGWWISIAMMNITSQLIDAGIIK